MLPHISVLLITWVAGAAPDPAAKIDPRGREIAESYKVRACATALDAVSLEVEKHYQAALIGSARGGRRAERLIESDAARQSLIDLELALVQVLGDGPLDNAARRFAAAAEVLLLRLREPVRAKSDGSVEPTASLQALLATHELFLDAAAHLRVEVEKMVRSRTLLEAMRRNPDR